MTQQNKSRSTSGAKAIALDRKVLMMRYRLYVFLSILGSAVLALCLHLIFGH